MLLFLYLQVHKKFELGDIIKSLVGAVCVWGVLLFSVTEILSLFNGLSRCSLLVFWCLVSVYCLVHLLVYERSKKHFWINDNKEVIVNLLKNNKLIFVWTIFAVVMVLAAIKTVPYNYDSMTYHMSRIFHWARNGSVAHYATHIDRQICSPVFGEFALLHSYVITGGDRFANLLQCLSFLFNGWLVYGIVDKLGADRSWSRVGMLLFYSAPICFSEALTTQVDNFGAMWALMFVYYILNYLIPNKEYSMEYNWSEMLLMGIMVGLGYLTKPNVCIPMFIFVVGLLIVCIYRRDKVITIFKMAITALISFSVIVVPEMIRNIVTFGSISSPEAGAKQLIGTIKPNYVLVNFIKNMFFNIPNKLLPNLGYYLYRTETKLAELLGVINDSPLISEDGRGYSVSDIAAYSCDKATSPIIFWLFLICVFLALVFAKKIIKNKLATLYCLLSAGSFLLLCCILRWEPYVGRYMIAFWGVLIPGMMYILNVVFGTEKRKIVCTCVVSLFCLISIISLFEYNLQFVLGGGRYKGYFSSWENSYESYELWANYINGSNATNIGLVTYDNVYEYPLDLMIGTNREIEHVNVTNDTSKYESKDFIPDSIVYINYKVEAPDTIESKENRYELVESTKTELGGVYELYN